MTPQCGRSVVQVLVVRVAVGVVTYEAMTPQCRRSVVQVLVFRVDIEEEEEEEAITPQCERSVVFQVVILEPMTDPVSEAREQLELEKVF